MTELPEDDPTSAPQAPDRSIPKAIAAGTGLVILVGLGLALRAQLRTRTRTLAEAPKLVRTFPLEATEYRAQHRYVGTLCAWVEAKVGPQFVSGYLTDVRVRPGASVTRGQCLAVIEPDKARAQADVTRRQVEAVEARLGFLAQESTRIQGLEKKGIVSVNDAENKLAELKSEQAKLEAAKANFAASQVEFEDTVQKAPFKGEVGDRYLDPGAFVRPGTPILTVVDRSTVRITADAPEDDYPFLAVGTPVSLKILATGKEARGTISRLSPSADASTRTLHFEIDLPNPDRALPVGTTAELYIQEREGRKVVAVPSSAATVNGSRATIFRKDGDHVRKVILPFLGEENGKLFLAPELPAGTPVVGEGRADLQDGDLVSENAGAAK